MIPDKKSRYHLLNRLQELLIENQAELGEIYGRESNLPTERYTKEFNRVIFVIEAFKNWLVAPELPINSIDVDLEIGYDIRKTYHPIGRVLVFGSSNFPLAYAIVGGDVISALAAGCPVTYKSHPFQPQITQHIYQLIKQSLKDANFPEDWINVVDVDLKETQDLILDPEIKAIAFTGSFEGGHAIYELAQSRKSKIPVFAEMGSLNPVLIYPESNAETVSHWANQLAISITENGGQFCTKPGLIFTINNPQVVSFLENALQKTRVEPFIHEKLASNFEEKTSPLNLKSRAENSILKISISEFLSSNLYQTEFFGPFALVVECQNEEEAMEGLKQIEGQLTLSIFSENIQETEWKTVPMGKFGRVIFNQVPTGVLPLPSMHHGGAYPASSDARFTAVGTDSINRFLIPISFQNAPEAILPEELKNKNLLQIYRRINGELTKSDICL